MTDCRHSTDAGAQLELTRRKAGKSTGTGSKAKGFAPRNSSYRWVPKRFSKNTISPPRSGP
jgi:hypothetical protein